MPRLPQPGSDHGTWGDVLNDFLSQALAANGQLKPDSVGTAQLKDNAVTAGTLAPNSVTNAALASNAVTAAIIADGTITEALLDAALQAKINAASAGAPVTSVAGKTGAVLLGKTDVGLGNADNTSDADKPVSVAMQTALEDKVSKTMAANQIYATDGSGATVTFPRSSESLAQSTVVIRGSGGVFSAGTPTTANHVTPKTYVDTALDAKVDKLTGNSRVYVNGADGALTSIGYSYSATSGDGFPRRRSDGTVEVGTPTASAHATSKAYVDTALAGKASVDADGFLQSAIINPDTRSTNFTYNPNLYNDLAYNNQKGGSMTVTKNGNATTLNDAVFNPSTAINTLDSAATPSDIYVITVNTWKPFPGAGANRYGIIFQASGTSANVKIELFYDNAWTSVYDYSDTRKPFHHIIQITPTAVTQIRYTLTGGSGMIRIIQLFAFAVNGNLLSESFLARGGDTIYGPITYNSDPTASGHLARKGYVDTKVAQTSTSSQLYATSSGGSQTTLAYGASTLAAASIPQRDANGRFAAGAPSASTDVANKAYVDAGDSTTPKILTGTSSTASTTAAKTVTLDAPWASYAPVAGDLFLITYTNGSLVTSATLSVNGATARAIRTQNGSVSNVQTRSVSGAAILYHFDGTNMTQIGVSINNTYTEAVEADLVNTADTNAYLISGRRAEYLLANEATKERTLTNKTLTNPRINQIQDTNGLDVLGTYGVPSAVNKFYLTNQSAGNYPTFGAEGPDTNIGITFAPKGNAPVRIYAPAGVTPVLDVGGPDADIDLNLRTQGSGVVRANGNRVATIVGVPATPTSAGSPGQIAYDAGHIYVCTAMNTWVRASLGTW